MSNPDIKTPVDTKPVTIEFSKEPPRTITVLPLEIGPNGENNQTILHLNIDHFRQLDPANTTIYVESHRDMWVHRPSRYFEFTRPLEEIPMIELVETNRPGDFSSEALRKYSRLIPTDDIQILSQVLNSTLESDEVPYYYKNKNYVDHAQLLPLTLALVALNLALKVSQLQEGPKTRFFMLSPSDFQGMNLLLDKIGVAKNEETTRQLLEFRRQVFISSLRILAGETGPAQDLAVINAIEMGQSARAKLCQTLTGLNPSVPFPEDLSLIEDLDALKHKPELSSEERIRQWIISEEVDTPQQKGIVKDIAMNRYARLRTAIEMTEHNPAGVLKTLEGVNQEELKKLLVDEFNFGTKMPLRIRYNIQLGIPIQADELAYFLAAHETDSIVPSKLLTDISTVIGVSSTELKGKLRVFTLSPDFKKLEEEKRNGEPDLIASLAYKFELHKTHRAVLLEVAERLGGKEKRVLLEIAEGKQPDTVQFREVYQHPVFRQVLLHEIGIELGARVNSILPDTGHPGDLYYIAGDKIGAAQRDTVNTKLKWDRVPDVTVYRAGILMLQGTNALGVVNIIRNLTGLTTHKYNIDPLVLALDAAVKSSELQTILRQPPILNRRGEYCDSKMAGEWYNSVAEKLEQWVQNQEMLLKKRSLVLSARELSGYNRTVAKVPVIVNEMANIQPEDGWVLLTKALGYKSNAPEVVQYVKAMVELNQPQSKHKVTVVKTSAPTPSKTKEKAVATPIPKAKELFEIAIAAPLLSLLRSEKLLDLVGIYITKGNVIVYDPTNPIGMGLARAIQTTYGTGIHFFGSSQQYSQYAEQVRDKDGYIPIPYMIRPEGAKPQEIAANDLEVTLEDALEADYVRSDLAFYFAAKALTEAFASGLAKPVTILSKAHSTIDELVTLHPEVRELAQTLVSNSAYLDRVFQGEFPFTPEGIQQLEKWLDKALSSAQIVQGREAVRKLPKFSVIAICPPDGDYSSYSRQGLLEGLENQEFDPTDKQHLAWAVTYTRVVGRAVRGDLVVENLPDIQKNTARFNKILTIMDEIRRTNAHTVLTEFRDIMRTVLDAFLIVGSDNTQTIVTLTPQNVEQYKTELTRLWGLALQMCAALKDTDAFIKTEHYPQGILTGTKITFHTSSARDDFTQRLTEAITGKA